MVSEIILDLKTEGGKLTGTVHAGNWPGKGMLINGKIEGNRISSAFIGKSPWWMKSSTGEASGMPRLTFRGTVQDDEIKLKLIWDSVMLYGDPPEASEYDLVASR